MRVRLLLIISMFLFLTGCVMFSEKSDALYGYEKDLVSESYASAPGAKWRIAAQGVGVEAIPSQDQYGYERVLHVLRIDPTLYRFTVEHSPTEPRTVAQWRQDFGAVIAINGGYFDEFAQSTGMLVTNGERFGAYSYDGATGYTGMFVVTPQGVDVRYLPESPLLAKEIDHNFSGIQSYPTLILPTARPGLSEDSHKLARRSIVAKDSQGNILLVVSQKGEYTLFEVMRALLEADINIDSALNLDGGGSTGLSVGLSDFLYDIPSASVPNVIMIFAK